MGGDYPSADFHIMEDGALCRVVHVPSGMTVETTRLPANPIVMSSAIRVDFGDYVARPGEVTQAALRHLRVWLMRKYAKGNRSRPRT